MKKTIANLLVFCLCVGLCACGNNTNVTENTTHPTVELTEPSVTETTVTEPTVTEPETWEVVQIVDDFGDPTEERAISATFSGTFSNTATSEEDLKVVVSFVNNDEQWSTPSAYAIEFRLLEYGDHPATYTNSDIITIKMKIKEDIYGNGKDGGESVYSPKIFGIAPNGELYMVNSFDDGLSIDRTSVMMISNELWKGHEIPCIIEIGSSKYSFTLDGTGYAEASDELKNSNLS